MSSWRSCAVNLSSLPCLQGGIRQVSFEALPSFSVFARLPISAGIPQKEPRGNEFLFRPCQTHLSIHARQVLPLCLPVVAGPRAASGFCRFKSIPRSIVGLSTIAPTKRTRPRDHPRRGLFSTRENKMFVAGMFFFALSQRCTRPEALPCARASTSATLIILKSCSTECLRQEAATAKLIAS